MSEQVMEELWSGLSPVTNSMELANAVIDRLQELNVDLQDVSLTEMKSLLTKACMRQAQAEWKQRNPRLSDCLVS
ncbi:hypothetical protein [Gimesia panareensis]|uniref:Uncharacterized protein n=1 Tax=Gimesia panareensis TaxID=2527978 RepID=A0A518A5X2_9PLAN|nr:hypothetical protein [Gimesia panareensis]QDT27027.1 hypothetical protein Enr10x_23410 [Gimesia panareensis]QDU50128.1 hypothetical protein Pan110_24700 [Gimesia panareensis]